VSRQNTFVGGTCAPPSALLVIVTPPRRAELCFRSFCHSVVLPVSRIITIAVTDVDQTW